MIGKMFLSILNMSFSACLLILAVIVIRFIILHRIPKKFICVLWAIVAVRLMLPFSIESPFSLIPSASPFQVSETVVQNDVEDLEKPEQFGQQSQKPSVDVTSEDILQVHSGFAFLDTVTNEFLVSRPLQVHVHRPSVNSDKQEGVKGESGGERKEQEIVGGNLNIENHPSAGLTVENMNADNSTEADATNSQFSESVMIEKSANMVASIWHILPVVWYIGVVAILGYAFYSYFRLGKKLKVSIEQEKGIYICDAIDVPFVFGLFAPKVYLPSDMEEGAFTYVVEHEKMHMARKDHLWKAIGYLLLAIHWMNPLVWVSYVLFCRDVELACDEAVIQDKTAEFKKEYAMTLFSYSVSGLSAGFLPLAFGEGSIKDRIVSVMRYKKPTYIVLGAGAVLCAVVAVLFLTNPKKEVVQEMNPSQESLDSSEIENSEEPVIASQPEQQEESTESSEEEMSWWLKYYYEMMERIEEEREKPSEPEKYPVPEGAAVYHSWDALQEAMMSEVIAYMKEDGLQPDTVQYYETSYSKLIDMDVNLKQGIIMVLNPDGKLTVYKKEAIVKNEWIREPNQEERVQNITVISEELPHKVGKVNSEETAREAAVISSYGWVGDVPFIEYFADELKKTNLDCYRMLLQPDTAVQYYLDIENAQIDWIQSEEDGEVLVSCMFENDDSVHYRMKKDEKTSAWYMYMLLDDTSYGYQGYLEQAYKRNDVLNHIDVEKLRAITVRLWDLCIDNASESASSYEGYAIIDELEDEDTVLYGYWDSQMVCNVMALRKGSSVYPLYIGWENMHRVMPQLYKGDFDDDGEIEYGIVRVTGTGSGIAEQGLHIIDFSGDAFHAYKCDWFTLFNENLSWKYYEDTNTIRFYDSIGKNIKSYEPKTEKFSSVSYNVNEFVLENGHWILNVTGKIFPYNMYDVGIQFTCQVFYDGNGQFSLGKVVSPGLPNANEIEESSISQNPLHSNQADLTHNGVMDTITVNMQYPANKLDTNETLMKAGYKMLVRVLKPSDGVFMKTIYEKALSNKNNTVIYLVYDDETDCYDLLELNLEYKSGLGKYSYEVFYLDNETKTIVEEKTVLFDVNDPERNRFIAEMVAFMENLQSWLDNGELLAMADEDLGIRVGGNGAELEAKEIWERIFDKFPELKEQLYLVE